MITFGKEQHPRSFHKVFVEKTRNITLYCFKMRSLSLQTEKFHILVSNSQLYVCVPMFLIACGWWVIVWTPWMSTHTIMWTEPQGTIYKVRVEIEEKEEELIDAKRVTVRCGGEQVTRSVRRWASSVSRPLLQSYYCLLTAFTTVRYVTAMSIATGSYPLKCNNNIK